MRTRLVRRGGLLVLALLAAGTTTAGLVAPAAQAATGRPALTYVQGTYTGATADASGCQEEGAAGYFQGWWIDWACNETYSNPSFPSLNQWELIVEIG